MFQFLVGFMALSLPLIGSLISCCGPVAGLVGPILWRGTLLGGR